MIVDFTCPFCFGKELVAQISSIPKDYILITGSTGNSFYGKPCSEQVYINKLEEQYSCNQCKMIIAYNESEMHDWLIKNEMIFSEPFELRTEDQLVKKSNFDFS